MFQGLSASLEVLPNSPDSSEDQPAMHSVLQYFALSFFLIQWFLKVRPWTSGICITYKLANNANSLAPPQTY